MIEEERIKSELELRLEKDGWTWLTNRGRDNVNRENLIRDYKTVAGFRGVTIEAAYDIEGKPLSNCIAIYVKK